MLLAKKNFRVYLYTLILDENNWFLIILLVLSENILLFSKWKNEMFLTLQIKYLTGFNLALGVGLKPI